MDSKAQLARSKTRFNTNQQILEITNQAFKYYVDQKWLEGIRIEITNQAFKYYVDQKWFEEIIIQKYLNWRILKLTLHLLGLLAIAIKSKGSEYVRAYNFLLSHQRKHNQIDLEVMVISRSISKWKHIFSQIIEPTVICDTDSHITVHYRTDCNMWIRDSHKLSNGL